MIQDLKKILLGPTFPIFSGSTGCDVSDIPYILESNPHPVFGDFLNGKKLVCDSNPHLSFNRSLPTGRLIE